MVPLEKLIVTEVVKEFSTVYRPGMHIAVFTILGLHCYYLFE
jgi:hypothetical protein